MSYEGTAARARQQWSHRQENAQGILAALPSASAVLLTVAIGAIFRVVYNKFVGRAMPPRGPGGLQAEDGSVTFSVATFNLRGVMDRWQERRPLLGDCLKQLDADVLCFQEVLTGEAPCWLVPALLGHGPSAWTSSAHRAPVPP